MWNIKLSSQSFYVSPIFFFCMCVSCLTGTLNGCSGDLVIGIEHGNRKMSALLLLCLAFGLEASEAVEMRVIERKLMK